MQKQDETAAILKEIKETHNADFDSRLLDGKEWNHHPQSPSPGGLFS